MCVHMYMYLIDSYQYFTLPHIVSPLIFNLLKKKCCSFDKGLYSDVGHVIKSLQRCWSFDKGRDSDVGHYLIRSLQRC